jgi:hypothetical protein
MVRIHQKNGLTHLVVENESIKAAFLPRLGSKMISLINKKTGTEFLLENQDEDKIYKPAYHGADYSKFDASGFDECFPTIEASELIVENNKGSTKKISFPDHGELWSKEWEYEIHANSILFYTEGVNARYSIKKLIMLKENNIIIDYTLVNESDFSFNYIWSGHPLLAVEEGDRIIMPKGADRLFLNWASEIKIGTFGQYLQLSELNGIYEDFLKIKSSDHGIAIKGFTDSLTSGVTGLFRSMKNESILISFDIKKLPYLGVWLCYGGWPAGAKKKHFTIALEPTTGRPDSLSESIKRNECSIIEAGEEKKWQIELSLWEGMPEI